MIDFYTFWQSAFELPEHLYIIYDILTLFSVFIFPLAIFFPFLALFGKLKGGRR